ncbi:MAG: FliH/SctL family protein, partial [Eubacterium sp.]
KEEAEFLVKEAKREAEQLHNEAVLQIQEEMQRAIEEGRNQGYQEGWSQAEQEIARKEQEIDDAARNQKRELQEYVDGIEKKYVDVLIALLQKLTGILIEDRDDLMLYLIQTTVRDLEPSDRYCIRVSQEDIYEVESNKDKILQEIGQETTLELVEEKGLEKGQCVIETQSQMVDCGFQTQLDTLIRDLKMLVHS